MTRFCWGILSTGRIARTFAEGLRALPGHEVAAVGSRSRASAEAFAAEFSCRAHASYLDLAHDSSLDAIYVATPHARHLEDALVCLGAGRPVLCEKPLCLSESQGRALIARAREQGVFLMEAMWTRFLPVTRRVRELLAAGALGDLRMLHGDFSFYAERDPAGRLFDPLLGGGSLLDVGVYCVAYASMLFGSEPEHITATADLGPTGVDEHCAWIEHHPGRRHAEFTSGLRMDGTQEMVLHGSDGVLRIPRFWCPDRLILNGAEELLPPLGNGYHYEAAEVERCVRAGLLESEAIPHLESLAILRTMDRVRQAIQVSYPGE